MNSGRRQRPTLWKIPLFTSAYASLARLKERSPSRSHGSVSMERSPVFHPIVSSRSPLIVSAPPAEIKLSDGTFVSAPLSLFPFCLSSFSRLAHTHPPTHRLSPYQHANKMSAQLGLTLARLWGFASSLPNPLNPFSLFSPFPVYAIYYFELITLLFGR